MVFLTKTYVYDHLSLKNGIKDVKRQIARQKKVIEDLSGIASPLGPKAVEVYTRKERRHLTDREELLAELKNEQKFHDMPMEG